MGEGKRAIRIATVATHRSNQNAQAIVELALILPILLVLIVGALEFGRLWSTKIVLTNAAREGAYYLSTHRTSATTCDSTCQTGTFNAAYNEAIKSGVKLVNTVACVTGDVTCTISQDAADPSGEQWIATVHTQTQVNNLLVLGLLGQNKSLTVKSSVQMMVQ